MKKSLLKILTLLAALYIFLCAAMYLFQEQFIFFPQKLEKDFHFSFNQNFEEVYLTTEDKTLLHGILFKSDCSKGLLFYLHGNAGSLYSWGGTAHAYAGLQYDVFMPDYRGFGKSEGSVSRQDELFQDMQIAYNEMKKRYDERNIIVLGYSIGTGPAAHIASTNNPKMLILQAPYFSLTDMMKHRYPFLPAFILKYPFKTNEYIQRCRMPVVIFHGTDDEVIPYESSVKLKEYFKQGDTLITLNGQLHNNMTNNPEYKIAIKRLLFQ